ncbi:Origin recognition complex subunit 4 [Morella rubra]|uniref:Origin of replication complex subunit 4 n=1 Tax=Morella rubra TaxID=262757 RepID=A0A6A1UZW2_9ROSI|nr:Origin recognition complex subunit 4 [Morella rubra]
MGREKVAEEALNLLRSRLCDPSFVFKPLSNSPDSNYSKLKFIISSSVTEACNNSILLLGPRGSGKIAVLELVLKDLLEEYPDMISVIRLSGLLHSDDNCAFKEIARQLCVEHHLLFSKMASFDDNSQFMIAMLRECGLAHKTVVFVLDEFDLFAQGKQRVLYSLLDAMQSVTSQAVVIGVSCRLVCSLLNYKITTECEAVLSWDSDEFNENKLEVLTIDVICRLCFLDADQLLEKRVRSRFSHRKLLFLPPSKGDLQRLLEHILSLPIDSTLPHDYAVEFNAKLQNLSINVSVLIVFMFRSLSNLLLIDHDTRFRAVSYMDLGSGLLSLENFITALSTMERQPKLECIKEYKSIHDAFQTSDYYARNVCFRAFEHLLQRELICFTDNRGHNQSVEFRPVKLLISSHELHQGLKSYRSCPVSCSWKTCYCVHPSMTISSAKGFFFYPYG